MMTIPEALELALQHHQAGRLADAEALYRQILAVQPNHADATHLLGVLAHQAGHYDLAVALIKRSTGLDPNHSAAYSNLGEALRAQGRLDDAIAAYRRALELRPDYPEAHNNLANVLRDQGRRAEALASYRRAIELRPTEADYHMNVGHALEEAGNYEEALGAYRKALEIKPNIRGVHKTIGDLLLCAGRRQDAIEAYRRAVAIEPGAGTYLSLADELRETGALDKAIEAYQMAIRIQPDCVGTYNNLGNTLRACRRLDEAAAAYRRALALQPDFGDSLINLGNLLREQGHMDEALAMCRRALDLAPERAEAQGNLGNLLLEMGQSDQAIAAFRRALQVEPNQKIAHSNLIYALLVAPEVPVSVFFEEEERWNEQFGGLAKRPVRTEVHNRNPERRLRVGYVSPDFRDHVVGRNVLPLLRNHYREKLEIVCYSEVARPDSVTEEFRRSVDLWRSTVGLSDESVTEMIRCDGIDILVDLSQHSAGNRLTIFTHQAAPVQVSFAGYPESTAVPEIEYRISDRWLEKYRMANDECRNEQVFLLDSFWCYDPCGLMVAVNEPPAAGNGYITFGSLNNFCKVNEPLLKLWARVLEGVPESRLVMLSALGRHRQRTVEFLAGHGIAPERVEFVGRSPRKEYLETYQRLDIVLDTCPYNGHTTSLDALWMGVPVVSLAGEQPVSRAGSSQLSNLGLAELVARSADEYTEITARLANDLPRLTELRQTLRARMEASVLMDAPRFARSIETAYRTMWRRWCEEVAR